MTRSPYTITPTPPTSIELQPGQVGTFSFTVTSLEAPDTVHQIILQALLIGADGAKEVGWLVPGPQRTMNLEGGKTETVTIAVRPNSATPKGEHRIKLSIADNDRPNDNFAESAPVVCTVAGQPVVTPAARSFPKWLIPVIAGAVVVIGGGIFAIRACSSGSAPPPDAPPPPPPDASTICDPTSPFDPPVALAGFTTGAQEVAAHLSPDELSLYFAGTLPGSLGSFDLYVAQRSTTRDAFGPPVPLIGVNSAAVELDPMVTVDGLTLVYFGTRPPAVVDRFRMFVSTRVSPLGSFGPPELISGLVPSSASTTDLQPFITADGQELWFTSDRDHPPLSFGIYRAVRIGAGFGNPAPVNELNAAGVAAIPVLSADRLTIYFSVRNSSTRGDDIWTSHRRTVTERFPPPGPVTELNTPGVDHPSWLSPDNCRLYITTSVGENQDIAVASRRPR